MFLIYSWNFVFGFWNCVENDCFLNPAKSHKMEEAWRGPRGPLLLMSVPAFRSRRAVKVPTGTAGTVWHIIILKGNKTERSPFSVPSHKTSQIKSNTRCQQSDLHILLATIDCVDICFAVLPIVWGGGVVINSIHTSHDLRPWLLCDVVNVHIIVQRPIIISLLQTTWTYHSFCYNDVVLLWRRQSWSLQLTHQPIQADVNVAVTFSRCAMHFGNQIILQFTFRSQQRNHKYMGKPFSVQQQLYSAFAMCLQHLIRKV